MTSNLRLLAHRPRYQPLRRRLLPPHQRQYPHSPRLSRLAQQSYQEVKAQEQASAAYLQDPLAFLFGQELYQQFVYTLALSHQIHVNLN